MRSIIRCVLCVPWGLIALVVCTAPIWLIAVPLILVIQEARLMWRHLELVYIYDNDAAARERDEWRA